MQDNKNDMTVDTLITTMNMLDASYLLKKMNIKENYIIGNQCDVNFVNISESGTVVSTDMRGVGQNRNNIVERSKADICVLADDDMRFCDNYKDIVVDCFKSNPEADVIIFNFLKKSNGRRVTKKKTRVNYLNYMNYGAARIAFRRKNIQYHAISFNTMFGGGTPHCCGEDSLFLNSCLRAGLKIIAVPQALAELTEERDSTWFNGYNEKFFFDKGVFFRLAHPKVGRLLIVLLMLKHKNFRKDITLFNCVKLAFSGFGYLKK